MADIKKIKAAIVELASRRQNVQLSEIEWVVNQLAGCGYQATSRSTNHQTLFNVDGRRFGVCGHHAGSKQVKKCYVDGFLAVMEELDLYEEDP